MDFSLSDEQEMLKESIADFMEREVKPDRVTRLYQHEDGFHAGLFRTAAQSGWLGMCIPEEYGGAGGSIMDCAVAFEEFGRGPLPAPVFTAGILSPLLVLHGGSEAQKKELLPRMCNGEVLATLAVSDSGMAWGPEMVESELADSGDGYVLNGTKQFVQDGFPANLYIVAARLKGEVALALVERDRAGVTARQHGDLLSSVAEVAFENVRLPQSALLSGGWDTIENALEQALPVLCAFQVGACQQIFDITVDYSRERIAFGQPIGRFQRVQDHIVELADHMDAARWITYETIWKLETGQAARGYVHEAKAAASDGYFQVVNYAHKVWAGPGTAMDHPLMAHHIASRILYQYLGDPAYHKRKMMDALFPV
ncbi:MAG TPA: acyl-CoA dehydrogenase family protein [Chloroflexota bacterium]|nr:acyl-CoA dehydrogenase family protein [Chloroflexota bacterium]